MAMPTREDTERSSTSGETHSLLGRKPTPLPKTQLAVACFATFAEFVSSTQIYPYMNQMIKELQIADKPEAVGFYSGLIDGLSSLMMVLTIYQWGAMSDRRGRRPIMISGLTSLIPSALLFGMSKSFWQLLVARAIAGAFCANQPVVRSFIGEITDETNQARAYPLLFVAEYVGLIVGPIIGGTFSHPVERYPRIFGHFDVLRKQPYLLPCTISAGITATALALTSVFLKESLPARSAPIASNIATDSLPGAYGATTEPEEPSRASITDDADVTRVSRWLVTRFLLAFNGVCFEKVLILFCYTPIRAGGLERAPSEIGFALALSGVLGIVGSLFVFPTLHHRLGTFSTYTLLMSFWPFVFVAMPILGAIVNAFVSSGIGIESGALNGVIWTGLATTLFLGRAANLSWTAEPLVVKSLSTSTETLGRLFGLGMTVSMGGYVVGPYLASSLFALSIEKHLLGGNLIWLLFLITSLVGVVAARALRAP